MERLAFEMEYRHPTDKKATVALVPYTDRYREAYRRIYNECFHEMRQALDIKPYDFIQDDSFFEEGMDGVFLLLNQEELVGSVALNGSEIDDLIVNTRYQGMGYGKQILLWALEHMQAERIVLHVAAWNRKAVRLYQSVGFEIVQTIVIGKAT